jgi:hypothetical protein
MINTPVALPATGQQLAQFILSLLGQRRTIEKNYDVTVLFVKYDWVMNTVAIVTQRVSQNIASLASFRALYYYENGKIKTVNSIEDFQAFYDNSQEKTVGIDIFMTYLVDFPHGSTPEKQDIRLEIFADIRPREFLRPIGRTKTNQRPLLKYTIYSTNVTWGEDLSSHLDRQYERIIIRDKLVYVNNVLDKLADSNVFNMLVGLLFGMILMWGMFNAMFSSIVEQSKMIEEKSKTITGNVNMETINRKLDVLLQSAAWGLATLYVSKECVYRRVVDCGYNVYCAGGTVEGS